MVMKLSTQINSTGNEMEHQAERKQFAMPGSQ